MNANKSEKTARAILQRYVESVSADLGDSIEAIILVGSLATGSYVPGPGDIDQITILRQSASDEMAEKVHQHIQNAMETFDRTVNMSTVVYRRTDLERPWNIVWDFRPETKHFATVPEELLRIHDHGQVIYGDPFDISVLPVPTMAEMIAYAERWREFDREAQKRNPQWKLRLEGNLSPRLAVQVMLSNAIWHYYYATGRTCFNKHEIANRLRDEIPEYRFLEGVEIATRVRMSGFEYISDELAGSLSNNARELLEWKKAHAAGVVPVTGQSTDD